MRVALHSEVTPGRLADYLDRHRRVPDDLVELFGRAGITDWTIWRSGERLFHLVECEDFEQAMAVVKADPADARWQGDIGRFVAGFLGPDAEPGYAPLGQVWRLSEQDPM